VVTAIPNAFEAAQAIGQCRQHNSDVHIIARAHSDEEESYLLQRGANVVILGEREIGEAMLDLTMRDRNAAAALRAVQEAIVPADAEPQRSLRRGGPVLTGIDEDALARAIGVPVAPPVAAPPAEAETPLVSETVVEVEPEAAEPEAPAALSGPAPAELAEPAPAPARQRGPATTAATPFSGGEAAGQGPAAEERAKQ
jgi:monovalent cation:H+ antiporter-2, CPA2 family